MECNQSNRSPKRIDKIRDKLLSIESFAYKARHLPEEKRIALLEFTLEIDKVCSELRIYMKTSNEKGKELGWWE